MLTDFENSFTDRLSSKFLVTGLLNIQPYLKCVATLPCEIVVFTNHNDPELCKENCHAAIQNICWKYLPSDVSIISVHWRNDIYSAHTKKPKEWLTECICSNQEERQHDKTPAHKINIQSPMTSVSEPQVVDSTSVWYLSIMESRLTRPIIVTWIVTTASACYTSDLKQVLRLSAGQCPGKGTHSA